MSPAARQWAPDADARRDGGTLHVRRTGRLWCIAGRSS